MRPSDDCAPPSSKNASADLSELGRTARRGLPLSVPRRRLRQRVFPGDLPRVPRHLAAAWGVTLGVVQARMEVLLLRMGGHLPAVSVTTRATGSTIRCIARRVRRPAAGKLDRSGGRSGRRGRRRLCRRRPEPRVDAVNCKVDKGGCARGFIPFRATARARPLACHGFP